MIARAAGLCFASMLGLLHGCGEQDLSSPPPVRLGRDECAECGMLINDDRFAAAMLTKRDGILEYIFLDDIGCLLKLRTSEESDRTIIAEFVQDHATRTWIKAETAVYLRAAIDRMPTPMGSGLAAFASMASAESARSQFGGEILTPSQLQESHRSPFNHTPAAPEPDQSKPSISESSRNGDAYYLDSCAECGHADTTRTAGQFAMATRIPAGYMVPCEILAGH